MKKDKKGVWKVSLDLAPGTYQYKFFVDGAWVNDPDCAEFVANTFGGLNCVKKVE
jgi:1,4-alpha-glucan branching enzyme